MTSRPDHRRPYIDRLRGAAVLIMILAHVMDAWTRTADRNTVAFRTLTLVGGFAAPLFLWVAGLVLALVAERSTAALGGTRQASTVAVVRRGLEIVLLAYLFRLQAFVVSPGSHPIALFRVDILNVMGLAMVAAGVVWGVSWGPRRAAVICGAAAAAIALATPLVRFSPWVDHLPIWVQWHLRPSGEFTTFTLFPWSGFLFAGVSAGSILSLAGHPSVEGKIVTGLGATGAALVILGLTTAQLPTIYSASAFWTSSPTYFAIRLGVIMLALAGAFAMMRTESAAHPGLMERFGRASLFVYWIHVELVYGYLTWPIHARLPVWAAVASYGAFCGVMYGALHLRDRVALRLVRPTRAAAPTVVQV